MDELQKFELETIVEELEKYRARHTELITVLIPEGTNLNQITKQLENEKGTASNIKSTGTRKNVVSSLELLIRTLKEFERNPENGLALYCGNVILSDGREELKVWAIEPPKKLNVKIYKCDQSFELGPLKEMLETDEIYALMIIERNEATIGVLDGKYIKELQHMTSGIPGKHKTGGQCLLPDSLVQFSSGSIKKIKDCKKNDNIKSLSINNLKIDNSRINNTWKTNKNEIYKIITKTPRFEIQSSKDHLFYILTDEGIIEKPASEIKLTDKLIIPEKIETKTKTIKLNTNDYYISFIINKDGQKLLKKLRLDLKLYQKELADILKVTQTTISSIEIGKINITKILLKKLCHSLNINFNKFLNDFCQPYLNGTISLPKIIDESLSEFLGYLVGNGCLEEDRVSFFEQDKQVALYYKKKFDDYFEYNSSYRFRNSKNYHQLRFTSRPLVRLIKKEFPELKKSIDSMIPEKILQSNNKVLASFIKGFFDADGYVSEYRGVGLGINNKILAQQIQLSLLRFSIISSIHEYDNNRNPYSDNARFTVDITEKESLELFKKNIGFSSNKKKEKLNNTIKKKCEKSNVRQIIYKGSEIRKTIESYGYNTGKLFPKVSGFFLDKRMMSKNRFKNSILDNIKDKELLKELTQIYNCNILPVQINRIKNECVGTEMVDISVDNDNFISNGLIVHNSAQRFSRLTDSLAKDFFKRVAEAIKEQFWDNKKLKGILIGGPIPTKDEFLSQGQLVTALKNKVIAVKDIGGTEMHGLQELVKCCQEELADQEFTKQKIILDIFFEKLGKDADMVCYGEIETEERLNLGSIDKLILSKTLPKCTLKRLESMAKLYSTEVFIVSSETTEGIQFDSLGGVGGLLRFKVYI